MQQEVHIFQGLKRDNHQLRQKPEFLWDALNIRLTNDVDSTLFSITNEKGTSNALFTFQGKYVGHCVLGNYLIVFTVDNELSYIYRVSKDLSYVILYKGNLGFSIDNPIQAIGWHETDLIQKVYWIDDKHQPRMINIALPELKELSVSNGEDLTEKLKYTDTSFDFTQTLKLEELISIKKEYTGGLFPPGTIQYAFSYYNKYGQESNIFYTTPLYYTSFIGRGGNPEDKTSNSFNITIENLDSNFDYIRVYSIMRTSIDSIPVVKVVRDLEISSSEVSLLDTGTIGYNIAPEQLLYIGGESIIAKAITQKDGTLFLGNITQQGAAINLREIDNIIKNPYPHVLADYVNENYSDIKNGTYYSYTPILDKYEGGFKANETYRTGLQFQDKYGKWSEPVFISDFAICNSSRFNRYSFRISADTVNKLIDQGVKRIRTCVVFPKSNERDIICQGILNPTVYSVGGRMNNTPYAQASWFFRPKKGASSTDNVYKGSYIQTEHNKALLSGPSRGAELQNALPGIFSIEDIALPEEIIYDEDKQENKTLSHLPTFFVDENILTFNSPDLEFDTDFMNYTWDDSIKLRIIGIAKLGSIIGDIDIQTSSTTSDLESPGFMHTYEGYTLGELPEEELPNGGLVSGLFYRDNAIQTDFVTRAELSYSWMIYPWHRTGSLNNDVARNASDGLRTSELKRKVISNLKFFDTNYNIDSTSLLVYDISIPQLFNSNEMELIKVHSDYLGMDMPYYGNVDTLVGGKGVYNFYVGDSFEGNIRPLKESNKEIIETSDPIRMKYKSTPHLVFSLKGGNNETIPILPSTNASLNGKEYKIPKWQSLGETNVGVQYDYDLSAYSDNIFDSAAVVLAIKIGTIGMWKVVKGMNIKYAYKNSKGNKDFRDIKHSTTTIYRVVPNLTVLGNSSTLLPGTTEKDYKESHSIKIYTGTVKYYKMDLDYNLIDVTEDLLSTDSPLKNKVFNISQNSFKIEKDIPVTFPYLFIAELYREPLKGKFGGETRDAFMQNTWLPACEPVSIVKDEKAIIPFEYGDTWYSRYDCLKTYSFTEEDSNSIIEIGSFMLETRVNIDGRYDRNRGQLSNLNMSPRNFNLYNEIYNQRDNFFNYTVVDEDLYKQKVFSNQITWSKEKSAGESVDTWTNITLASTLDMDGSKGEITSLNTYKDALFCFQERAVSTLLFNSRVQIPTSDGTPIEINNGQKMDGSRYISDTVGCQNKWSIVGSNVGLMFIDNHSDTLWSIGEGLTDMSNTLGMRWWFRDNHYSKPWLPYSYSGNNIRSFYDSINNNIYFLPGQSLVERHALCYSGLIAQFTSQMSYGGIQAMFKFGDNIYSLNDSGTLNLYQNFTGPYNKFYGEAKEWYFSFISNDNPLLTKVFDTIELKADMWNDKLAYEFPLNYIEVNNEYQHAKADINSSNMRKKFRVWRGLLPRASEVRDFTRTNYGRSRIRNNWTEIKLGWEPKDVDDEANKSIVHDVTVKYTV